ncbi:MAG: 16S rRNA (cytosine(1402)-N(4))-methyltransferase RsmH [Candidatus Zixiibacteriota bacterium]|nr:MAG: 16S rRNA (cytosine(1402)-N(4))-methyltransferase RsmH [candidate division Zixibacteria bacterium]
MVSKGTSNSHEPVLVEQVIGLIATGPSGAYLDLTVGAGGHLKALSDRLGEDARLYGLDRDASAVELAGANLRECPQLKALVHASYSGIGDVVRQFEDQRFDGILMDLGISSVQLDDSERGFSFRFDGPLDMRFDAGSGGPTAADLVNRLSESQLAAIVRDFGEQANASGVAKAIVKERRKGMILTTAQLKHAVLSVVKPPHENKALARVFQALRIAVNEELEHLARVLPQAVALLASGGRLAVISYHSLEDRLVKRFFQREAKGCVCPDSFDVCMCGRQPVVRILTRRVITAGREEKERNPRSRSARLRAVERL